MSATSLMGVDTGLGGTLTGLQTGQIQLRTETKQSNTLGQLAGALAAAQGQFTVIKKDKLNPYYNSYYADLDSVIAATRPALSKNELAIMQFTTSDVNQKTVTVRTLLVHKSGEFIDNFLTGPGTAKAKDGNLKFDAQSIGINTTYFRRYAWQSLVGVAAEDDDDGNAASPDTAPERPRERPQVARPSGQGTSRPANSSPAKATPKPTPAATREPGDEPAPTQTESDLPTPEAYAGFTAQCKEVISELTANGFVASKGKTVNQKFKSWLFKTTNSEDMTKITNNQWLHFFALIGKIKESGIQELIKVIEGEESVSSVQS